MKKIWGITSDPSALAAARTPVSVESSVCALIPTMVVDQPVAQVRMTVDAPPSLPQAHWVPAPAGPAQGLPGIGDGGNGFDGFTVKGFTTGATKRYAAAARGVPPRGRPV